MKKPDFLNKKVKEINNDIVYNQNNSFDYVKKYNIFVEELATKQSKYHLGDTVIITSNHPKYPDRVGKLLLGGCDKDSFRIKLKDNTKVVVDRMYVNKICKIDYIKGK